MLYFCVQGFGLQGKAELSGETLLGMESLLLIRHWAKAYNFNVHLNTREIGYDTCWFQYLGFKKQIVEIQNQGDVLFVCVCVQEGQWGDNTANRGYSGISGCIYRRTRRTGQQQELGSVRSCRTACSVLSAPILDNTAINVYSEERSRIMRGPLTVPPGWCLRNWECLVLGDGTHLW